MSGFYFESNMNLYSIFFFFFYLKKCLYNFGLGVVVNNILLKVAILVFELSILQLIFV